MRAEGKKGRDGVRVGRGVALRVDGGVGRKLLVLAFELFDAAHRGDGGGPVNDDGVADRIGGGESPGVRVGAEGGEFAHEGNDFGEGGGAVGVGDVAFFGDVHDVAAAPEVVEGVIDADLADAVFVGHGHAFSKSVEGDGLAELEVGVPGF